MSHRSSVFAFALALSAGLSFIVSAGDGRPESPVVKAASSASDAPIIGRLEIARGDSHHDNRMSSRHEVNLVDDAGRRIALDPVASAKAAADLNSLPGKRVAMVMAPEVRAKSGQPRGLAVPEAIVPVDSLVPTAKSSKLAATRISGTTTWVTLMCKFRDIQKEQKDLAFFQGQYANTPGRLDHYWREVSHNKINLEGSKAYGWFTLPHDRAYYVTSRGGGVVVADLGKLMADCTKAADRQVDFSAREDLYINMMFNGPLDGYTWGGTRCGIVLDGIERCWNATWNSPQSFNNLGNLAHEMGHAYGLGHSNNSDGDASTYDNPWDLMSDSWSNAVEDSTYGRLPKHLNVFARDALGWIDAAKIRTHTYGDKARVYNLQRASRIGAPYAQMIKLMVPDSDGQRYYTLETRMRTGDYEANLPGDAVIIHYVNLNHPQPVRIQDIDNPPATQSDNEGSMFKVGETVTIALDKAGRQYKVQILRSAPHSFTVQVSSL